MDYVSLYKKDTMESLTLRDPRLAYYLLAAGAADDSYSRLRTHTARATFTTGTPNQVISTLVEPKFCVDECLYDVAYQIRRPNAFANNVLKSMSDFYNALNGFVDITVEIQGSYPESTIAKNIPIELFARAPGQEKDSPCFPCCLRISYCDNITVDFILRNALPEQFLPYEIIMVFSTIKLGCSAYGNITAAEAILRTKTLVDERLGLAR